MPQSMNRGVYNQYVSLIFEHLPDQKIRLVAEHFTGESGRGLFRCARCASSLAQDIGCSRSLEWIIRQAPRSGTLEDFAATILAQRHDRRPRGVVLIVAEEGLRKKRLNFRLYRLRRSFAGFVRELLVDPVFGCVSGFELPSALLPPCVRIAVCLHAPILAFPRRSRRGIDRGKGKIAALLSNTAPAWILLDSARLKIFATLRRNARLHAPPGDGGRPSGRLARLECLAGWRGIFSCQLRLDERGFGQASSARAAQDTRPDADGVDQNYGH